MLNSFYIIFDKHLVKDIFVFFFFRVYFEAKYDLNASQANIVNR